MRLSLFWRRTHCSLSQNGCSTWIDELRQDGSSLDVWSSASSSISLTWSFVDASYSSCDYKSGTISDRHANNLRKGSNFIKLRMSTKIKTSLNAKKLAQNPNKTVNWVSATKVIAKTTSIDRIEATSLCIKCLPNIKVKSVDHLTTATRYNWSWRKTRFRDVSSRRLLLMLRSQSHSMTARAYFWHLLLPFRIIDRKRICKAIYMLKIEISTSKPI